MVLFLAILATLLTLSAAQTYPECTAEVARSDDCAAVINANACYNKFRWNAQTLTCIDGNDNAVKQKKIFWSKGEDITIQWDDNWPNWGDGPIGDESLLDLWITGYANDAYVRKLLELDTTGVRQGGQWNWTVDVPNDRANGSNHVFRWKEHRDDDVWDNHSWGYRSKMFAVSRAIEPSSLSSTTTSNSGAESTAMSNSMTTSDHDLSNPPSQTTSPEDTPPGNDRASRGTSPGVVAGAAVGSLVGLLAIVAAFILGLKRGRTRKKGKASIVDSGDMVQNDAPTSVTATPTPIEHNNGCYKTSDLPEWVVPR
ncbi:hypothetical protein BKA58DRAFT_435395 [Alternaria rosae]|uniref:uncharacterized protein n=1 Tax=Alternaria rosae TaxID=1187941 RepID=UPI001E8D8D99|nr:uncharacterized protein BKA58DRAFT_435395 [Alternaria rosae]KAH6877665.1 hypothetical protein BKA58DRAFT_435395 [Alternaria rosae]